MLDTWRKVMRLLDAGERSRFRVLLVLLFLMGLANMVGVAAIIPFLAVLAKPEVVESDPWLAKAYELIGFGDPETFLLMLGIVVFTAFLGSIAVKTLATYAMTRFALMRTYSLAVRVLRGRHNADLVKMTLGEAAQVVNGVLVPLLQLIAHASIALSMVLLMVLVNPLASGIMAVGVGGLYAVVYLLVRRRLASIGHQRFAANQSRFRIAQEALLGAKEVKVLGLEETFLGRFRRPALTFARMTATANVLGELPRHLLEGAAFGSMMAVVLVLMAIEGDFATILPVIGLYAVAGSRLLPAMQQIYRNLGQLRFNQRALGALYDDLIEAERNPPLPMPPEPLHMHRRLELREVFYAYPNSERPALHGLTLEIRANSTVGIVGGTGAGKTTAMDVILGLLPPQRGALMVDGREIAGEAALRAWRRSLGYVPQSIFLIDDDVAANIAFGIAREEIDHAAVERAARMAEMHRFVTEELPHGYATKVGDRGVRLSGGQRQRIGIARALYHDPDMLILDEATSALDNLTERAVMDAVAQLGGAKTIVMVAHRLSTVRACDEIFLLEHGRLAARGTYDELVEQSDVFREMARGAA
jgi:ABC-type multidrug transport system fused ATPase/permease subunit